MKILIGEEAITEVSPCSGETDLFFFAEIWSSEVADVSFLQRNAFCKLPLPASPFHLCFATGGPHRSWVSYKENYKQFHPAYLVIYWEDLCSELCCCGPGNGSHGWLLSDDQSVARIVNERRRGKGATFSFFFFVEEGCCGEMLGGPWSVTARRRTKTHIAGQNGTERNSSQLKKTTSLEWMRGWMLKVVAPGRIETSNGRRVLV